MDFRIDGYNKVVIGWKFKNGHIWHQYFDTAEDAQHFANKVGLVANQDIVNVVIDVPGAPRQVLKKEMQR